MLLQLKQYSLYELHNIKVIDNRTILYKTVEFVVSFETHVSQVFDNIWDKIRLQ